MIDSKTIEDLAHKLSEALPPGLRQAQEDAQKQFKGLLQSAFAKMDLVTREEFDVQIQVLAKTRARLEVLEQQLAALEVQVTATQSTENKQTN